MGCGNSKNAMQAISEEVQPTPTAPLSQRKANLPPQVMLGFEKVLKTASATPQGPLTERVLPETKGDPLLSPNQQGKTGHDITPMESVVATTEKQPNGAEQAAGLPSDLLPEEPRLDRVKTLVDTDPGDQPVPVSVAPPLPQINEESEAMLNAYMEQPVTNPYLELMRTQEQGKMPLPEVDLEPMGPPLTPKAAFAEDQSIPATS